MHGETDRPGDRRKYEQSFPFAVNSELTDDRTDPGTVDVVNPGEIQYRETGRMTGSPLEGLFEKGEVGRVNKTGRGHGGDKVQITTGSGFFRGFGDVLVSRNPPGRDANSALLNVKSHTRHDVTNDYNLWS